MGKEGASEAENRRGSCFLEPSVTHLLSSAFKKKGGSKNGIPGGLRGQIQAEGTDVQYSHWCLVLFPLIREALRCFPESNPDEYTTEKDHKGCKRELPHQNSRPLMCCPHFSCPLRLKIPMMQPCGPNKPSLRHPPSWLCLFSTDVEGSICDTQAPESPLELRDSFRSHPHMPTLMSQPGQHPGQLLAI